MDYILLLGLFFCLVLLVVLVFGLKGQATGLQPYTCQSGLFSPAERSFYMALRQTVGDRGIVFAKVRLADLIKPIKGLDKKQWQRAFNRISAKHVDFVICDPSDLSVNFLVELDDKSHQRKDRIGRDLFLDQACLSAGIKLYRFKAKRAYALTDIAAVLYSDSTSLYPTRPESDHAEGLVLKQVETV